MRVEIGDKAIFSNIFYDITNDNLFKAQSSFELEMVELRSILKRCNDHSLIIADELSRGTESHSAVSIVAASLQRFVEKESNVNTEISTNFRINLGTSNTESKSNTTFNE